MTPTVKVSPKLDRNQISHDISLSAGGLPIGLIFDGPASVFRSFPFSDPPRLFSETQTDWTAGRGRRKFREDPTAYFDGRNVWSMTGNRLFPTGQYQFGTGVRTVESAWPVSVTWKPLYGALLYSAATFTASASSNRRRTMMRIRQVGKPGTLTYKLAQDNATPGTPGTILQTVTLTATTGDWEQKDYVFDWGSSQAVTSGSVYWEILQGASTDNATDHWEVAVDTTGTGKVSTDGSTWTTPSPDFKMYYRTTDADTDRFLYFWEMDWSMYIISVPANNGAPQIWINGDRGTATSGTATTLVDTRSGVTSGWTNDEWIGWYIKIIDGVGVGTKPQLITDNDSTSVTVASWEVTPTSTSRYVIYGGTKFTELTGHGLTVAPTCRPVSNNKITMLAQGTGVDSRQMRESTATTNNHQFAATVGTIRYDFFELHPFKNTGLRLWAAKKDGTLKYGTPPTYGGTYTLLSAKGNTVGSTDTSITALKSTGGRLFVGKEDGLWEIEENIPSQFTLPIKDVKNSKNCVAISSPGEEEVYFTYGHSLAKLEGTHQIDLLNYRFGYDGLPSDRRGYVSQIINVLGWTFFSIDGGASNYSAVYAWNGRGVHEIWRGWKTGLRIRDIFHQVCEGTRSRLWIDAGGEPIYIELPLDASNPLLDTTYPYNNEMSWTTGIMDIEKEDFYKLIHEVKVMSQNLSSGSRWVEMEFQTDADVETSNWTRFKDFIKSPADNIVLNLGEIFKIRFRFRAYTTSATTPPIITSTDVLGSIAEPMKYQWIGTFRVADGQRTLNNQDDFDPSYLVLWLQSARDKRKKITMGANSEEDDNKLVVTSQVLPEKDTVNRGKWSGRIQLQLQEC